MDAVEQNLKDAKIRQEKAEEETQELSNKQKHLESEVDVYGEKLTLQIMEQESMENKVMAAEAGDRMAKVLQNRSQEDEKKMSTLAEQLKDAQKKAEDADTKYDEASKKMQTCESQLEVDGERA